VTVRDGHGPGLTAAAGHRQRLVRGAAAGRGFGRVGRRCGRRV